MTRDVLRLAFRLTMMVASLSAAGLACFAADHANQPPASRQDCRAALA